VCGRLTLTAVDVDEVAAAVDARIAPEDAALYRPRFNAAPSDRHWIVRLAPSGRVLVPATWGIAAGLINIRAETAERKFAEAFARRRVVVPADGFYEWSGKQPLWFRPEGGGIFVFAGLAETLADGREAFAVLTMEAGGEIARIHDRMPVILQREAVDAWLSQARLSPLPAEALLPLAVSRKVNNVRNDAPDLLEPPAQLGLF
jgi:putative SOS response-associated peptidase YedK